jgi:hypothetical protein
MEIHNKTLAVVGVIIFNAGVYLDYGKHYHGAYLYILLSLGIILMLLSFKKTRAVKD